jgi:lipopolysaccharide export LptBFGC system permease protein LptF
MQKLVRETGIAVVIFALLSFAFGLGGNDEKTVSGALLAGVTFGVVYFLVGLAINWFKGRNS